MQEDSLKSSQSDYEKLVAEKRRHAELSEAIAIGREEGREEVRMEMLKKMEDAREEAYKEAFEEGYREGIKEGIEEFLEKTQDEYFLPLKLFIDQKLSKSEIIDMTGYPEEFIDKCLHFFKSWVLLD